MKVGRRSKATVKKGGKKGRSKTRRGGLFNPFKRKPTPEQLAAQKAAAEAAAAEQAAESQRMAQVEAQRRQMAEAYYAQRDKEKIKETGRELLEAAEKGERLAPTRVRFLREFKRYVEPQQTESGEFDWPASIAVYKQMAETGVMPSA